MKRYWRSKPWRSAAQCLFGGIGLAAPTFVCFRLGLNLAAAGFAYLILIVVLALLVNFMGSVFLSVAVVLLNYFTVRAISIVTMAGLHRPSC